MINTNGVKMGGELNLKNGKITMPDGEVYGLNIRFPMNYENEALQVASGKPIHISTKNLRYGALSVANGELDLFGRYPNTMKNPLILKNVKVSLFDGELTISQLTFPQSKMATLSFTNIDLAQVLALAQYNQVTLTGRANATLPFWLGHKECLICNGTLEQVGNVSIKLTDEMVKGLKKGGWTENILVDLFGGSPYNAASRVASERNNTDIVTGINLPMLLEVLDAKDGASLDELVETAKEVGVAAVKSFRQPKESKPAPTPAAKPPAICKPRVTTSGMAFNASVTVSVPATNATKKVGIATRNACNARPLK